MPIADLYGHDSLRARLGASFRRGTLPASLLIHGPRGVGKQRLALWLGQLPPASVLPGILVLLAGLAIAIRAGARAVPVE